ncbi:MAG: ABC transporter substrate-binding protein [Spirochaeta sp. LUC14_002_19_P3]|nr:MAG: ABC transporter substrate-binding protein [Spirochaeta sp. LUC14_002_19_P3]
MNKKFLRLVLIVISMFAAVGLGARGNQEAGKTIAIASKFDTEGALLGNMMRLVLENAGFNVIDKTELGPTDVVRKALETGEVDMYPEYTGNGNWFFSPNDYGDDWYDREKALAAVRELDKAAYDIAWLEPAPANNTWAIAVQGKLAADEDIVTLSDFAAYVNSGGKVKLAGSEEFVSRPDSLPAFQEAYNFMLSKDQLLVLSSGNTALTEQAAARGTDGVNAAMAYGTDGPLAALGLVVLEDNLGVQMVYEPAPRVRASVLAEYPELESLLNPVFTSLDLKTLQTLNAKIAVEGISAAQTAEDWLKSQGFIN